MPGGAAFTLTPELATGIAQAVADGVPIETAATIAKISHAQLYEWLAAAERGVWKQGTPIRPTTRRILADFADQIARAQAEFEAKQLRLIAEAAEIANEKTGQRDWRASGFLLTHHPRYRRTYHEYKQVETTSTVDVRHVMLQQQVRELPTEELERLARALPDPSERSEPDRP